MGHAPHDADRRRLTLGDSGEFGEGCLVAHGDIRQDFSVDGDLRFVQTGDEAAIGQTEFSRRRVDTDDP
jgi:hypothetical protein